MTATLVRWLRSPGARQTLTVLLVLLVLELLMFWGYFTGEISPAPDDFIGSYNNEPFAWWHDLSAGGLPDWVPYAWGGYPAAISIQSGAWYLPLGLAAAVSPYSIHAAAVVQALHVAAGALGVYVLGRRWVLGHLVSMFGLVAYFFAVGFYTNGLHPDIVRGFAWAPWVFLVLSPAFPWRRAWGVPLAAFILWQALVGTYPGVIVALAYGGLALVVASQIVRRPPLRSYLIPLAAAGVVAVLLSAPKYVTALTLRGGASPTGLDDSVFSGAMLGTLFFPYDMETLPNDLSMRSFFVVAPVWVLVALAWRHRRRVTEPAAAALTAAALGLPFLPWYDLAAGLPGMSMSRFRMADFRAPLVLSLVLVAMVVLAAELHGRGRGRTSARVRTVTALCVVAVPTAALLIAVLVGYEVQRWATPWAIVVASAVVVWWLVRGRAGRGPVWAAVRRGTATASVVGLTALAAVSGVGWAYDVTPPWRFPREEVETSTWGTDSDALIAEREDPEPVTQRPARTPLDDAVAPPTDVYWNTSFYTADDAVGGYVNLKGSASFDSALIAVTSPETYFESRSLLAAPGLGIAVEDDDDLPAVEAIGPCALDGACGADLTVHPDGYDVGHLRYQVDASQDQLVLFNEAYYPGWTATACATDGGACQDVPVSQGASGMLLAEMPEGDWTVSLDYSTPGKTRDLALLALGVALAGAWAVVVGRRRGSRPASVDAGEAPEQDPPLVD